MNSLSAEFLLKSLNTSFIDDTLASSDAYRPALVLNKPPHQKVLSALVEELRTCTFFRFSVAFITLGGLMQLHQAFLDAQERGVKGEILTSDYLNFTEADALLAIKEQYPHIILRIVVGEAFHAKGYFFTHQNHSTFIVGSANITAKALAVNREWNVRFHALHSGEFTRKMEEEFSDAWSQGRELDPLWLEHYRTIQRATAWQRNLSLFGSAEEQEESQEEIIPNSMQREALQALADLRMQGKRKALLISATGTGKTYLCAFDVQAVRPNRFLFIVHREQVARRSMESFQKILGTGIEMGMLGAGNKTDAPFVFAMIQTLSKNEVLSQYPSDYFDYIVVDEVHHSGANSYRKVLDHFTSNFLLGMTATPERSDGFDIYELFDHTVAYEIRLKQALEANLLAPFHYFGVKDLTIDGKTVEDTSAFSTLVADERVLRIGEVLERYSLKKENRRGLIFCSRVDEANELSDKLNILGYRTRALSGQDDDQTRTKVLDALASNRSDHLQYVLAVDILNEGIDIPILNQIIMLRPTQSAIVFVQQLGRGLRKFAGKKFVTVIDFIGNYQNNFLIPIALFGAYTYEKDELRRYLSGGSLGIPGVSTIDFERVARQEIFASIDNANFTKLAFLKEEYLKMKGRVGRVPSMMDFANTDAISALLFVEYAGSYRHFLQKVEKTLPSLSTQHMQSLLFLSRILSKGLRPYEMTILSLLLAEGDCLFSLDDVRDVINETYASYVVDEQDLKSALRILSNGFFRDRDKADHGNLSYVSVHERVLEMHPDFRGLLREGQAYRRHLEDLLAFSSLQFQARDQKSFLRHDLYLYGKYSRAEALLLLGWEKDMVPLNIGGYVYNKELQVCPIFVTLEKDVASIDPGINYKDSFLSAEEFAWETKHGRDFSSPEVKAMDKQQELGLRLPLFVKKHDDEGLSFYYMGDMTFIRKELREKLTGTRGKRPIVAMWFRMQKRVEESLYRYLTGI
jgi:superfamily II DNA or RNA helicase/HKD family nuclease